MFDAAVLVRFEHLAIWGYALIFLLSFGESLAFIGLIIPGSIAVITAGFLASQGFFDLGDLFFWSSLGAILGDNLSFYLGKRGWAALQSINWPFKSVMLVKGKGYFKRHGARSVFLGRFVGWVRPVIPFIAGMFQLDRKTFLLWNVTSGLLWAAFHLALGYFAGQAWQAVAAWSLRVGVLVLLIFVFLIIVSVLRWLIIRIGKQAIRWFLSLSQSIKQAVISNTDVQEFVSRHDQGFRFLRKRLTRRRFNGLPLTLLMAAFIYTAVLFLGLIGDLLSADPIVAVDIRLANLLYVFRDSKLIPVFLWITVLGKSAPVIIFAVATTIILWLYKKKRHIAPLWLALLGSQLVTSLGKLSLHRARPSGLVPVYIEHSYSFPSGHATVAVAFYGFLVYLLWRTMKSWKSKINVLFAGLAVIAVIGFSRLYLGVHYLSDVLSGYLLGLLWLIISISIIEWQTWRTESGTVAARPVPSLRVRVAGYSLGVLALAFYGWYAWSYQPQLLALTPERTLIPFIVNKDDITAAFTEGKLPKFTETLTGVAQEPLSFIVLVDSDDRFVSAFKQAGWYQADQVSLNSITRIATASLHKKSYNTAPMTPSFWNSRVHDFGLEKPTDTGTVNQRHHARFWRMSLSVASGKVAYVGTASFDVGIKWLVTHRIQPDIDTERDNLLKDLQLTGMVADYQERQFVNPTLGRNFSGDEFFTDGRIFIVELK